MWASMWSRHARSSSGEKPIAAWTPMPPARLTATTTSGLRVNANNGKVIPS
jgi:hypothetical protein